MQTNRLPLSKFGGLGIFSLMSKAISLAPAQSEARERCETGRGDRCVRRRAADPYAGMERSAPLLLIGCCSRAMRDPRRAAAYRSQLER